MDKDSSKQGDKSISQLSKKSDSLKHQNRSKQVLEDYEFNDDIDMLDPMLMLRQDSSISSQSYVAGMTQGGFEQPQQEQQIKISASQLLDDIYDNYLAEIPDNLEEAMKLAEETKVKIIGDLFAQKILQAEMDMVTEQDEEVIEIENQYLIHLKQQRSIVEKYINACLFDRIAGEKKFRFLSKMQSQMVNRFESKFKTHFQKIFFDNEAAIIRKFHQEFWNEIDLNFNIIVNEEISKAHELSGHALESKLVLQRFFLNYLMDKSKEYLYDALDEFIREFQSTYEENWTKFVRHRIVALRDQDIEIDNESLQILFNIMIRLPLKKEVLREIVHLNSKMMQFAFANRLEITLDESWTREFEIEQYTLELDKKVESIELQSEKENFISSLLFCTFHYFMGDCYTASDRELLKELIMTLKELLLKSVMQNKNVDTSFYLTAFEREIAQSQNVQLKQEYFLKDMALENFQNELLNLGIQEGIEKASILNLQKISSPQTKSRHIVICISGFLTEDIEKKESWRHAINHYKHAEVYGLNWNSLSVANFLNTGYYKGRNKSAIKGMFLLVKTGKKQFRYALEQTKVAGTMLALFLLNSEFVDDRAISLIGHSLGTVIIMQTLNILNHYHKKGMARAGRIIHDVFLWGGAAVLNPQGKKEEIFSRSYICGMVNGKVCNCYSLKDYVLKYIFVGYMSKQEPIGVGPIFEEIPDSQVQDGEGDESVVYQQKFKKAQNFDCTLEAPGHTMYSEGCNLILEKIPFAF